MRKQSLMWFVGTLLVAALSACAMPGTEVGSTPVIDESVLSTAVAEVIATTHSPGGSSLSTQVPPTSESELVDLPLPPAGLVYRTGDALWSIDSSGQPSLLSEYPSAVISPKSISRYVYIDQDDLWLADQSTGEFRNLTQTPERGECCIQWPSSRPDVILFGSWALDAPPGPGSIGFPTVVGLDGEGYRVLEEQYILNFDLSPDGETIAYDDVLQPWDGKAEAVDPTRYGLSAASEIYLDHPAWSPDGSQLAWLIYGNFPELGGWRYANAVFDLESETAQVIHPFDPQISDAGVPLASWSPDGQWLAFHVFLSVKEGEDGVWILRAGSAREVFVGDSRHAVWKEDSRQLAFTSFRGSEMTLWLAEPDLWIPHEVAMPSNAAGESIILVDWITLGSR